MRTFENELPLNITPPILHRNMSLKYLIIILIFGSPAFGLEVILRGKPPINNENKAEVLKYALPIGIIIVALAVGINSVLVLEPVYLVALIFALTLVAGELLSHKTGKEDTKMAPSPEKFGKSDIKSMLKNRGLGSLIGREQKEEKSIDGKADTGENQTSDG